MKKFLFVLCVAALAVSACSKNKKGETIVYNDQITAADVNANTKDGKYKIIDQEFDNLLAPDADYDTLCAYELQACGDSYLPPAAKLQSIGKIREAARKVDVATATQSARAKKVVNVVNVYEVDGNNPNIPVSSTRTEKIIYKDGKVVSSSVSGSSGAKAASGSTTTTSTSTF